MKKEDLINHAKEFYDTEQIVKIEKAIDFMTVAHGEQKRANGDPYIVHPLSVADILVTWGMDVDSVIAGLLHDTIEDTKTTTEDIKQNFGDNIAMLVVGLTKVSKIHNGMRDLSDYLPQTKDNLSKLLIAVSQDVRVIIIKLADRLHNLQTLQYLRREKQQRIARESLEVFAPMADQLGMGRVRLQLEELAFNYLDPVEFKKLQGAMKKRLGKSTRKLGLIKVEVETALEKNNIQGEINGRVKSIYSLHKKLAKVGGNMDDIYDLMALRIIVDKKEDCYLVLSILHTLYRPMIGRIKDYIATPKPNGYQSLHTTVITPAKQIVEFQIRTHEMHDYAERGLAASFHYNAQKTSKEYIKKHSVSSLPENLQWITQLQKVAGKLINNEPISREQLNVELFHDRIFVYSPKGDIFNLPEGALPLDFAYMVHTDLAKHAVRFKVNGNIHPFDKPLSNGDIVEVETNKLASPKASWKDLVTTTHARAKLQQQLRKNGIFAPIAAAANIFNKKNKGKRSEPVTVESDDKKTKKNKSNNRRK